VFLLQSIEDQRNVAYPVARRALLLAVCVAYWTGCRGKAENVTPGTADLSSPQAIDAFLARQLGPQSTLADVEKLMAPLAQRSAWVPLGGTGARQRHFQVPGDLRVLFELDGHDRLLGYAAYQSSAAWRTDDASTLLGAAATPDVQLILLSGAPGQP